MNNQKLLETDDLKIFVEFKDLEDKEDSGAGTFLSGLCVGLILTIIIILVINLVNTDNHPIKIIPDSTKPNFTDSIQVVQLKIGQIFLQQFGRGTKTCIVKAFNKKGIFFTTTDWLWSENEFISFQELQEDEQFKPLGMYPKYGKNPR